MVGVTNTDTHARAHTLRNTHSMSIKDDSFEREYNSNFHVNDVYELSMIYNKLFSFIYNGTGTIPQMCIRSV